MAQNPQQPQQPSEAQMDRDSLNMVAMGALNPVMQSMGPLPDEPGAYEEHAKKAVARAFTLAEQFLHHATQRELSQYRRVRAALNALNDATQAPEARIKNAQGQLRQLLPRK